MVLKKLGMSKKFVSWILFELYNNRKKEEREREREFFGIMSTKKNLSEGFSPVSKISDSCNP